MSILIPGYIQLIQREPSGWFQTSPQSVVNFSDRTWDSLNKEKYYGLTKSQIITELFRRFQGKLGYYLVHLAERKYYYCGTSDRDIQAKLWELGITQPDRDEMS